MSANVSTRAVLGAASLLVLAVFLFGDASRTMFSPQVVSEPTMTYGYVSEAQLYGGMPAPQQTGNVQYAQPLAYTEPRVQIVQVPVTQGSWGWSDLALLAIASGCVGVALGKTHTEKQNVAALAVDGRSADDVDEEIALTTIATLAVGGESQADLETLAKNLNPAIGYYDPLNLSEGEFWGQSNEATVGFLRHAEIKHGRVAMAGFVGYCVHANGIHFPWKMPGDELCAPGVAPTELWQNLPYEAKLQIVLAIGIFEFYGEAAMAKGVGQGGHYMRGGKPGLFPAFKGPVKGVVGDSEGRMLLPHPVPLNLYDPFNFNKNKSDEWKAKKLQAEINNGRLAMIGLMAFLSEGAIPGSVPALKGLIPATGELNVMSPFDFSVATLAVQGQNVPAAAPRSGSVQMFSEGDIGVLPPLGVYDPLGLIETRDMRPN
jgi:hypothetical protein